MTKRNVQAFIFVLSVLAILSLVSLYGIFQISGASEEVRTNVKVARCQNVVLGQRIYEFDTTIARIALAKDPKVKEKLIRSIENEQDLVVAMKACEDRA